MRKIFWTKRFGNKASKFVYSRTPAKYIEPVLEKAIGPVKRRYLKTKFHKRYW